MNYTDYLASPLWKRIRAKVLKRDSYKCRLCETRRATQVHHRSYDSATMAGQSIRKLYSVCNRCHELLTFDVVGEKRSMQEMQRKTALLDHAPSAGGRRRRKRKKRRAKLDIEAIRALSLEYAEGKTP